MGIHWGKTKGDTRVLKRLGQGWHNLSIKIKYILLMVGVLAAAWVAVGAAMIQLHGFTRASAIIMDDYMDITEFLDAFSAEIVCLEEYIRPNALSEAEDAYREAIRLTDRTLLRLRPSWQTDQRAEYVLKRAIQNAMEYYRASQETMLSRQGGDLIAQYLSLKTQSSYIDGYARELLDTRMTQGEQQWREIESANSRHTRELSGLLVLSMAVLALLLMLFTRSFIRPLTDLGRAADIIGTGQYDAPPLAVRGKDELGRTAQSFNLMQREIRRTFRARERQAEMEKSLLKKEAEAARMQQMLEEGRFAQLQSQINPHFLFNTLSTIAALAREEQAPLSEDLILRLSSFFRYSLESDEKLVTLGREIQLLRDYMELQETRYGERISMEICSDPALEGVVVPKFILQPLVENAILHGLRSCPEGGHIRVRVRRRRQGGTVVTVTDNGCGFDPAALPPRQEHRSVGLDNIAQRMALSGGRLDVFSRPGIGTVARITVKEAQS